MDDTGLRPELVADEAGVRRVSARAAESRSIALDTESDSLHSYHHKLCLIQLSFDGRHVVIDPLALPREGLRPLGGVLADPGIEKIMHGADYDLRVLHRDLGVLLVNVADTQLAAQLLGEEQTGLAALVARDAGIVLDKRLQRADWGARPLTPELLAYAAGDTAYLGPLKAGFAEKLAALGRSEWWQEECRALEDVRWEAPEPDPLAFEKVKGSGKLAGAARDRLAALYAWREGVAADQNVPPFKVLHAETVLALAETPPADLEALAQVRGVGRGTVRRFGQAILRALTDPPAVPARAPRPRFVVDRAREARIKQLRDARDGRAKELALSPSVLASRAALEAVVDGIPSDQTALRECLGRDWKTTVLAPVLMPLVEAWRSGTARPDAHPA